MHYRAGAEDTTCMIGPEFQLAIDNELVRQPKFPAAFHGIHL